MADSLYTNPVVITTAAGVELTGVRKLRLLQWVNFISAQILDEDDLVLTINGVEISIRVDIQANMNGVECWRAGPFNPGIPITDLEVTVIDGGHLIAWFD